MSKIEKFWWEIIIVPILMIILGVIFKPILEDNHDFRLPALIFFSFLGFLGWHLLIAIEKIFSKDKNRELFPIKFWISGVLSLIFLFIFSIINYPNNIIFFSAVFFPDKEINISTEKSTEKASEESYSTSTESINETAESSTTTQEETNVYKITSNSSWFLDDCIPSQWNVFNTDSSLDENSQCIIFDEVDLDASLDELNIIYSAETPISFVIYRPIDDNISEITFRVYIKELMNGDKLNASSDFYFGFIPYDINELYGSKAISSSHIEFNGEYVIFSGHDVSSTQADIHHNTNTYSYYDPEPDDLPFKGETIFQVSINIYGNTWNVNLISENNPSQVYTNNGLNIKGNYFTFGFRIPIDGFIDLSVLDFSVK